MGRHLCEVKHAEKTFHQVTGNWRISLHLSVVEGAEVGKSIYDDLYLTKKARWWLERFFRAAGVDGVDVDDAQVLIDVLVGRRVLVVYGTRDGDENTRQVAEYLSPGASVSAAPVSVSAAPASAAPASVSADPALVSPVPVPVVPAPVRVSAPVTRRSKYAEPSWDDLCGVLDR